MQLPKLMYILDVIIVSFHLEIAKSEGSIYVDYFILNTTKFTLGLYIHFQISTMSMYCYNTF